ncbi:MAG: hypothetical protein V1834_00770 [Candidatus Micrarchaeota archaeon]
MRTLAIFSLVVFAVAFAGVYVHNETTTGPALQIIPPYHYETGELWSLLNAFLFVTIVSALLFGVAAPIALGIEGLKYGSMFSLKTMPVYDLVFIVPQLFACLAATTLAHGTLEDYQGRGSLGDYWREAIKYFLIGLLLLGLLIFIRPYF